ncbi:hypothetical protein, partial [Arenibacter certesii]|uniref:hypothetical protein n=1 Tax=Arenibacter certesii TaxID=228955 RepID=UPI001676ADF0
MKIKYLLYLYGLAIILSNLGCKEKASKSKATDTIVSEYPDYDRKTQSSRTELYTPEKELAGFQVP